MMRKRMLLAGFLVACAPVWAEPPSVDTSSVDTSFGDRMLEEYFRAETAKLADATLADIETLEDWEARRGEYRRQLAEMLGLWPEPPRTDLRPVITGRLDHEEFTVEKIHFQSLPGLYVTANLYVPKDLEGPAPTILYVCGHGRAEIDGVSYGNKTSYQHHPAWFARNGYVAMAIDTIQLGEIMGTHHGTYSKGMWWWNARGYTPAGVEAWNSMRAIDYLVTRPEVDADRIGITGRSGGGAYSWWTAALDDRVKVAVPVAGITDLENHIVDDCIEGHCDCMYMVNTYRWDFPLLAALVAPRPLLISNSDKDTIFPLEGVLRVHSKVRDIYRLYDAEDKLGLQITEGGHGDTQVLRVHAFQWFNRFLKGEDGLIDTQAVKFFDVKELRVFDENPTDELTTKIEETFVPKADPPTAPQSAEQWETQRNDWMKQLRERSFAGWPDEPGPLGVRRVFKAERGGVALSAYEFNSDPYTPLRLYLLNANAGGEAAIRLEVLNEKSHADWLAKMTGAFAAELKDENLPEQSDERGFEELAAALRNSNAVYVYVAPRGIGRTAWSPDDRDRTHIRRRFALLGQTLDAMRVWDVRRALQSLREIEEARRADVTLPERGADATLTARAAKVTLTARGTMAGIALYASLFEPGVEHLDLGNLPISHRTGPIFLNVLRVLDMPQALVIAAERTKTTQVRSSDPDAWRYSVESARSLGWPANRLKLLPGENPPPEG